MKPARLAVAAIASVGLIVMATMVRHAPRASVLANRPTVAARSGVISNIGTLPPCPRRDVGRAQWFADLGYMAVVAVCTGPGPQYSWSVPPSYVLANTRMRDGR